VEDGPPPVVYNEVPWTPSPPDARTTLVHLDRTTGRLATEFTPPENVVTRRVGIEELPGYAPDPSPKPLLDEKADPVALKRVRAPETAPAPTPRADGAPATP